MPADPRDARWPEWGLYALIFATRCLAIDQPILENYVGRQVPTAMVARNLARGSGFHRPELDTGPFPNLFLVEPPIYAQVVAWGAGATGRRIGPTGRVVSALATTLAAWGLFGLIRRKMGRAAAVAGLVAFGSFPATIRYGRAVQPDMLAMGLVVAGCRCLVGPRAGVRAIGWGLVAAGVAQKAYWIAGVVPFLLEDGPDLRRGRWKALALATLPCLAWYGYAGSFLLSDATSAPSWSDNAANWADRLSPRSFVDPARLLRVLKDFFVRSFTPMGPLLALVGLGSGCLSRWTRFTPTSPPHPNPPPQGGRGSSQPSPPEGEGRAGGGSEAIEIAALRLDSTFRRWMGSAGLALLVLYGKLHHDYYWLLLAPPMAAWVAAGLSGIASRSKAAALACLAALATLGLIQSRSTWRTPVEWADAPALARSIRDHVPPDALLIAPEAIIYLGERRGCRLEYEAGAVRRSANEWRPPVPFDAGDPRRLVDFFRRTAGARYFADLEGPDDLARRQLHDSLKRDPSARVVDERPGHYLLVAFDDPETPGTRRP